MWRCPIATIGELIINLNANTASFVTDLNRVKNLSFDTATQVQRSFSLIGTAAMGMIGTALAGFAALTIKTADYEVQMLHLAQAAGTTTETMSGLAFAFNQMGLDAQAGATAMEYFAKNLYAFQTGTSKGAVKKVLEASGIDPASIKTSDDALRQFADHIAAMNDGFTKTAQIKTVMGITGAQMAAFLNEGSEGIDKFIAEANRLGLVVTTDQARAAEAFKQNMGQIEGALKGAEIAMVNFTIATLNQLDADYKRYALAMQTGTLAPAKNMTPPAIFDRNMAAEAHATLAAALTPPANATDDNKKAFDALKKSVEAITTSLKTQIATLGMSSEAVQEYKIRTDAAALGQTAWGIAEAELYRQQQNKLTIMQELAKIDNETTQASKKRFLEDKLALDLADIDALGKQLDVMMQLDLTKFSPTSNIGAVEQTQAFTDALTQQTNEVEHSIATFGMSKDQITAYDLAQLDSSVSAGKLTANLIAEQDQLAKMTGAAAQSAAAWKQFGDVANRSLDDLIFSGKSFTQVLADITKQLGEMFLKWSLFGFGDKSAGGGGILGGLSSLFSGLLGGGGFTAAENNFLDTGTGLGFASGGPVDANVPILVGERGPEIFTPSRAGVIIPNNSGGGNPVNIIYQIDARGSSITEAQFQRSLQLVENRAVQRALQTGHEIQLRTA